MSKFRTALASPTAAVNWIDIMASGEVLDGETVGTVAIRTDIASRVAVGVADPGVSTTAGIPTEAAVGGAPAGKAVSITLGAAAAVQSIWVQTPASQDTVYVEIDPVSGEADAVYA